MRRTPRFQTNNKQLALEFAPYFNAIKATFPTADYVAPFTIFEIGGNKFRLIAAIHHNTGRVYVRHVFTHLEYDKWSDANRRQKRPKRGK
jgi:mRNA interferase HigB